MQIVVTLSEEDYNLLVNVNDDKLPSMNARLCLHEQLKTGIILPKGHGKLIDGDKLIRPEIQPFLYHLENGDTAIPEIDILHAPTIIEADKDGQDER